MGEVVSLDIPTTVDLPPNKVLQGAIDAELTEVIVVGFKDKKFYCAYSMADVETILYSLERAKFQLMQDDAESNEDST